MERIWIDLFDVRDVLPREDQKFLLGFHRDETGLIGKIVFFVPQNKTWAAIGEIERKPDYNDIVHIDDITDWVDYWAVMPPEMFATEEGENDK